MFIQFAKFGLNYTIKPSDHLKGAKLAASPADVARNREVVFIMVKADAEVENIHTGETGILAGAGAGSIIVNSSTISPNTTNVWRRQHNTKPAFRSPVHCGWKAGFAIYIRFLSSFWSMPLPAYCSFSNL
jgi:3-hydroxyisobutyrate dehydrogenase-like beta-hydroxyacid dehydrogenase